MAEDEKIIKKIKELKNFNAFYKGKEINDYVNTMVPKLENILKDKFSLCFIFDIDENAIGRLLMDVIEKEFCSSNVNKIQESDGVKVEVFEEYFPKENKENADVLIFCFSSNKMMHKESIKQLIREKANQFHMGNLFFILNDESGLNCDEIFECEECFPEELQKIFKQSLYLSQRFYRIHLKNARKDEYNIANDDCISDDLYHEMNYGNTFCRLKKSLETELKFENKWLRVLNEVENSGKALKMLAEVKAKENDIMINVYQKDDKVKKKNRIVTQQMKQNADKNVNEMHDEINKLLKEKTNDPASKKHEIAKSYEKDVMEIVEKAFIIHDKVKEKIEEDIYTALKELLEEDELGQLALKMFEEKDIKDKLQKVDFERKVSSKKKELMGKEVKDPLKQAIEDVTEGIISEYRTNKEKLFEDFSSNLKKKLTEKFLSLKNEVKNVSNLSVRMLKDKVVELIIKISEQSRYVLDKWKDLNRANFDTDEHPYLFMEPEIFVSDWSNIQTNYSTQIENLKKELNHVPQLKHLFEQFLNIDPYLGITERLKPSNLSIFERGKRRMSAVSFFKKVFGEDELLKLLNELQINKEQNRSLKQIKEFTL